MYPLDEYDRKYNNYHTVRLEENHAPTDLFFITEYDVSVRNRSMHRHQFIQINYVSQGEGFHELTSGTTPITKGDIMILPPYIPHAIHAADSSCRIVEFEFAPEFINRGFTDIRNGAGDLEFAYIEPFLLGEQHLKPKLSLNGALQFEIESILAEAKAEFSQLQTGYILLVRALLLKLLILVGREYSREQPLPDMHLRQNMMIWQAVGFINENCHEPLTVEGLAEQFSYSPSHFRRLFKNATSFSVKEYIIGARIRKAMQLLRISDKKIVEISALSGFSDPSLFYKHFKRMTGGRPQQFR